MRKVTFLLLFSMALVFCGCAMPNTVVRTVDDRPTLAIKGAPEGAVLFVDGLMVGPAANYNGDPNILTVEPGTHLVRIAIGSNVLYEQKVFVESSLKVITVR